MSPSSDAAFVAALRSGDTPARLAALERLALAARPLGIEIALAALECLAGPSKALQRRAADVLRLVGADAYPEVVRRLRRACATDDPRVRWGAAFALGHIGILEPALIRPLLEALAHPDGDQRWAAAGLMVACGRRHPDTVVPALLAALVGDGADLRKMALYALRDLAPGTPEVANAIVAALADAEVGVRLAALSALRGLAPSPAGAADRVLRLLREDPDPGLRRAAVSALGHVGRGIESVRLALDRAAAAADPGLRRAAEAARRRLGSAEPSG